MTLPRRLLVQPCTVRYWSAGPPDSHNNQTDVFTNEDMLCSFQERSRLQTGGEAEIGVTLWFVFLPPDAQIPMSADRIIVNGTEYNFHGDGWLALDIRGEPDHIELTAWKAA
jgi:hypothetical protein